VIKTAAVQMHATPGMKDRNIDTAVKMIKEAAEKGAELISLPELWVSGYYLSEAEFRSLAEPLNGELISFFQDLASTLQVVLIVPFVEQHEANIYNAAAVIDSDGTTALCYRKSFLWGRENDIFTPGEKVYKPAQTSIGKIGVLICADIELPEPSRILAMEGAELIVVPSVWSLKAESRWDIQLPARALDNTVFVLGVNTVQEGSCGKSRLAAPDGSIFNEAPESEETLLLCDIDFSLIEEIREELPYLQMIEENLLPRGITKQSF
jgi:5-aminopentanamidase